MAGTGIGLYFGALQLFFTLSWTVYVVFLPQLAAQAGIDRSAIVWILLLDQVIFALCDWAAGIAADRVARIIGRLGMIVAGVTAVSAAAFLLLPLVTGFGPILFLALTILWSVTSSALRAPPLVLLGRYAPPQRQAWISSFFLLGIGLANAGSPLLAAHMTGIDPRLPFALSAFAVFVVTLSTIWAERNLARENGAPPETALPDPHPHAALPWFLVAVALLAVGFQVHAFVNSGPLYLKFAKPPDLIYLTPLFWLGFDLLMLPASLLAKRFGGAAVMALGALVAAAAAWAASQAHDIVSLGAAQFIAGAAWSAVTMSTVTAALAIGRPRHAGRITGIMFSLMAAAAMGRILIAGLIAPMPVLAEMLSWLPACAWLLAGLLLLTVTRPASAN